MDNTVFFTKGISPREFWNAAAEVCSLPADTVVVHPELAAGIWDETWIQGTVVFVHEYKAGDFTHEHCIRVGGRRLGVTEGEEREFFTTLASRLGGSLLVFSTDGSPEVIEAGCPVRRVKVSFPEEYCEQGPTLL